MSAHVGWALICRLFASGAPVMRTRLSASEIDALPALAKAVKQTSEDVTVALCPYCGLHGGEVRASSDGRRECWCPECGAVSVDDDDLAAFELDDHWLRRTLRAAQDIQMDGESKPLIKGAAWNLGISERVPVVLTRDIRRLWREPGTLDRVRVKDGPVRVIAPAHQIAAGVPLDAGVEWLALEERFRLRGEGLSFLGAPGGSVARRRSDPAAPVHGPFSADFRLVYLDGEDAAPIRCTKAQADVFRALWDFAGKDRRGDEVMQRAGRRSSKPIDVFKAHPEPKRAYEALVDTNQKDGLYCMPCAAR